MPYSRRTIVVFAVAAIGMLAAVAPRGASAASCNGMSHELSLSNGAAAPGSAPAGSTFTFTVTYQDNDGCDPSQMLVRISGLGSFPMKLVAGDLVSGTFRAKVDVPAGSWDFAFDAISGSGAGLRSVTLSDVDPAKIDAVPPQPRATDRPGPKPTAAPRPTAVPTPVSVPATQIPRSTPGPATPAASPHPPASEDPPAAAGAAIPPTSGAPDDGGRPGDRVAFMTPMQPAPTSARSPQGASRTWLVLLVASLAALLGLLFFAALSTTLADPPPGRPLALLRGRVPAMPDRSPRQRP